MATQLNLHRQAHVVTQHIRAGAIMLGTDTDDTYWTSIVLASRGTATASIIRVYPDGTYTPFEETAGEWHRAHYAARYDALEHES